MKFNKLELFKTKKEFFLFLISSIFVLSISILYQVYHYKQLTKFDTALVDAMVLKQYEKTKQTKNNKTKTYQVLKLRADDGFGFYTWAKKNTPNLEGKKIQLEIKSEKITFFEYMNSFYSYAKIVHIYENNTTKQNLNSRLDEIHKNRDIASIYKALYTAYALPYHLQQTFSILGVSHLLAISGFHLGVLAAVLYFLFKPFYKFFQNRFFPYRSYKIDSFIFISVLLLFYLIFLDSPPSLLRAYAMMIVGFFLYDRGFKIVSMQTLFVSVVLLLAVFPRLFFAIGFWLSAAGVFYIFLFLIYFKHIKFIWQSIILPIWVYLVMLPLSLVLFNNFSLSHPLSIIWSILFTIFYPLSILLHLFGVGDILDAILLKFLELSSSGYLVELNFPILAVHLILSLIAVFKKSIFWLLGIFCLIIFIYAMTQFQAV